MKWTNDNLMQHAIKPVMQWLIWAAHNQSTITYGKAAKLLVHRGFNNGPPGIIARRVGNIVPGNIMPKIRESVDTGVPPLNVLMVGQKEPRLPGPGVCRDLAIWYGADPGKKSRLERTTKKYEKMKKEGTDEWKQMCNQTMSAVYTYTEWNLVYKKVWREDLEEIEMEELEPPQRPQEPDGTNFPGGGEGDKHRSLREWIMAHPEVIHERYKGKRTSTEWILKSGDRVDVVVYLPRGKTVAVEVKSCVSNDADLERGIYQCIKYRAVINAMGMNAEAALITESELPRHLQSLASDLDVKHVRVRRTGKGFSVGAPSGSRRGRSPETVFGMLSRPQNPSISIDELSESAASGWAGEV